MSTVSETNQLDVGGWSPDTLHAWVRSMLDQIDRRNEQRFAEQEAALEKALITTKETTTANFHERDKACELSREVNEKTINIAIAEMHRYVDSRIENLTNAIAASRTLKLSLIDGVKTQISAVHREIDIETKANKEAVDKADKANEKRFESVNEFRAQMADQSALFISRREVEAMVNSNADKVAALTDRINRSEGRGSGKDQLWGYIVGGVGIVIAFMMWINSMQVPKVNTQRIDDLQKQQVQPR